MKETKSGPRRLWIVGMLLALIAGVAWTTAWRADRDLRRELLQQTRLAAQTVDIERVNALGGTAADLERVEYRRLKEQLASVRESLPPGRTLRLIGRKADGSMFAFVDSEAAGGENVTQPGQAVDDPPADLRRVFDGSAEAVAGPFADRRGRWVSAWVPLREPATALSGLVRPEDAQAMVRQAVDFYRRHGRERFLIACNDPRGPFRRGSLYAFAYDLEMTMLAHPVTPELVGQNLLDQPGGSGGRDFRREIQEVALAKGSGWVDYPYENPLTRRIESKTTYVERVDDLIINAGAYSGSGELRAVLAMNIDSRAWQREVAFRSALPVGLMLALSIGLLCVVAIGRRVDASPKPLLRRLLPPLAAMVVLLTVGAAALLWQQHQRQLDATVANGAAELAGDLRVILEQQALGLATAGQLIAADATVRQALREGDAGRLLAAWRPVFEAMRRENGLTHFYFLDRRRTCLLRLHKPERRGDRIDRFTAREAERSARTAAGIELGPLGTFTLRVVLPVFAAGSLVGYVELGKEIEDVMQALHQRSGSQLAVLIDKELLDRQTWEEGMRFLAREADWDRLPRRVVIYASQGRLPDAFARLAEPADGTSRRASEIAVDGRDWRVSATPLHDAAGGAVGELLVLRDISAENEAFARLLTLGGAGGGVLLTLLLGFILVLLQRADAGIRARQAVLQDTLQLQKDLLEAVPAPIFCKDAGGVYIAANKAFARCLGRLPEQIVGRTVHDFSLPEPYDRADRTLLEEPGVRTYEASVVYGDGTRHEVLFNKATFTNSAGRVAGLIGVMLDISERKLAEEKLRLAASVFTHAREGILITAADGTIIDVNDAFRRITGYSRDEVIGRNPRLLSSGRHDSEFYAAMWRDLVGKGYWYGEVWNRRKNGEVFAEMQTISSVRDDLGNPREYVALFSDITVLKAKASRLEHIAHYDALTALPNRVLLADRLQQAMARAQRYGQVLALAFLDLDGFKAINDQHGHRAGDELLIGVAARMKHCLRESDTLARLGGDEFVAVLLDLADAAASLPMLSRLLAAAAQPVPCGEHLLQVSASLGVTFYPQAAAANADQLLRQADQAMYRAKLSGKNRYHVFGAEEEGGDHALAGEGSSA